MPKNAIYLVKNAVKNQTFFSGKIYISLIRNLLWLFSDSNSEAGGGVIAIQVLSGV